MRETILPHVVGQVAFDDFVSKCETILPHIVGQITFDSFVSKCAKPFCSTFVGQISFDSSVSKSAKPFLSHFVGQVKFEGFVRKYAKRFFTTSWDNHLCYLDPTWVLGPETLLVSFLSGYPPVGKPAVPARHLGGPPARGQPTEEPPAPCMTPRGIR